MRTVLSFAFDYGVFLMAAVTLVDTLKAALTLNQAADLFPRRPHVATMHRWCLRGCRGVKLRSWMIGSVRHTTPDAVEEFLRELNRGNEAEVSENSARRSAEAGKALEALGG
jgi:hypothetical protein